MATTKIEWTDRVWNCVTGCTKVSAGCKNCYAEGIAKRFWAKQYPDVLLDGSKPESIPTATWERDKKDGLTRPRKFGDVWCHGERLEEPYRWRKGYRVFVNSMSDLFHESIPFDFVEHAYGVMGDCQRHTFQILTKRPHRMLEFYTRPTTLRHDFPNVWLGISIEAPQYKWRINLLRETPAVVRFLSIEPLLEDMGVLDLRGIHWVIVGGESGPRARPMHPDWVRAVRDQCARAGVPFFFKQWGEWSPDEKYFRKCPPSEVDCWPDKSPPFSYRVGKKKAGCLLDGKEYKEFPR